MKEFFKKFTKKETWKWIFLSFIWVIPLSIIIDFGTKWLFNSILTLDDTPGVQVIPGFFYLALRHNIGAAWSFSFIPDEFWGRMILLAISLIMSGVLLFFFIKKFKSLNTLYRIGLTLMAGGAIGNLIDRAFYWKAIVGHDGVIDFLSFYVPYLDFSTGKFVTPFPTFNIADSCLTIGAVVLVVAVVIETIKDIIKKQKAGEYKYSPKELKEMEKTKEQSVNEKVETKDETNKD